MGAELPPGFTLDAAPKSQGPPLPPGFSLDAPFSGPMQEQAAPQPANFSDYVRAGLRIGKQALQSSSAALPVAFAELGANQLTGAISSTAAELAAAAAERMGGNGDQIAQMGSQFTYQPRTPLAQGMQSLGAPASGLVSRGIDWLAQGAGQPGGTKFGEHLIKGGLGVLGLKGLGESVAGEIAGTRAQNAQFAQQNQPVSQVGAASATSQSVAAQANPELQQAVNQLNQKGAQINPEVLNRKIEADSLPVKVKLTAGQATGDPVTLSNERNLRANQPEFAQHFNLQEKQIVENLQAVRDQTGPEVFSTSPVEHGDTLIKAYQDKAAIANKDITAKYQALRDANGGQFPVDARAVLRNATAKLNQELLFDHAPPEIMRTLNRLAENDNMTFQNFESLRTNLARIQRSAADGNVKAAAGVIRGTLEDLPMNMVSGASKQLADVARQASKAQFDALDADPAYKAAVTESVPPDRFVQRFVINGPRDAVATMRQNLVGNDAALQTLGVSTVDYLRQSAGLDSLGNGRLSQARFNKNLQGLAPKLNDLVGPQTADTLQRIGNVARYIQEQPAGSFVNNSNTFTAQAGQAAAKAGEGMVNYAFHGLPIGTFGRRWLMRGAEAKAAANALAPEAGLDYVPNSLPRVKP